MPPVSRRPDSRKKVPRILEKTRSRLADLEPGNPEAKEVYQADIISAIQQDIHEKVRLLPQSLRKTKRRHSNRSTASRKKQTPFEQKVLSEVRMRNKGDQAKELKSPKRPGIRMRRSNEKAREKTPRRGSARGENLPINNADSPSSRPGSVQVRKTGEKILGKFKKHPVLLFRKYLMVFVMGGILFFILSALARTSYREIYEWGSWGILLVAIAFLTDFYIRWNLNVSIFTEDRVISLEHNGVTNHSLEVIPIGSIKYQDLKQEGLLKTMLDYGDIHITSFITESSKDMTLANIGHVKEAFAILQDKTHAMNKQS